jgi:DNA-binding transcriptional LysR family regulator
MSVRTEPSGLIRVNAPLTFGVLQLAPLWGRFRDQYPKVALDITLSDRIVDLVEEGYDIAVRISSLPSSTLVSRKLTSTRLRLCASETYLKKHGVPQRPPDLAAHRVISYTCLATQDEWQFTGPKAELSNSASTSSTPVGNTCL